MLIKGYKIIRENQGEMSRISLQISEKIRELFPEILLAILCISLARKSLKSVVYDNCESYQYLIYIHELCLLSNKIGLNFFACECY